MSGQDLKKARHHLSSQVRAGAAPNCPSPAAPWAPFQPRPPARRSPGDRSPVHGLRFRRAETTKRAAEFAHCLASATPGVVLAAPAGQGSGGRGSGILCPGGRRRTHGGEPHALRRKRGRSPENAGDFLARRCFLGGPDVTCRRCFANFLALVMQASRRQWSER